MGFKSNMKFITILFSIFILVLGISFTRFFSDKGVYNANLLEWFVIVGIFIFVNSVFVILFYLIYYAKVKKTYVKQALLFWLIFSPLAIYRTLSFFLSKFLCGEQANKCSAIADFWIAFSYWVVFSILAIIFLTILEKGSENGR